MPQGSMKYFESSKEQVCVSYKKDHKGRASWDWTWRRDWISEGKMWKKEFLMEKMIKCSWVK